MPIYSRHNLYQGVNAHLQSQLQTIGEAPATWESFHFNHITDMARELNRILPDGYRAVAEQSLQITPSNSDFPSVVIYQDAPNYHPQLGRAITRLELLSPANKKRGSHYPAYSRNRRIALRGGMPLVEIDYLHESQSPILGIPHYPDEAQSYAYHITVNDPRQANQHVQDYGFGVDEPFPRIPIPLADTEQVILDLNQVYPNTFYDYRWGDQIDYASLPERFDTYHPTDQARIQAMMKQIQTAHQHGHDLRFR